MSDPEQIFSRLTRDVFFSKVDCSKGYWQIAMNHSDIELRSPLFHTQWAVSVSADTVWVRERWRIILPHDEETVI